jgi:replicative DNA helicase
MATTIDDTLRRVPPQNLEAEESVLGGVLLDNAALDRVVELVQPDDFYRGAHRKLFNAMLALSERSEPVDLITLSEALRSRGDLADVGGTAYLGELAERVPTAANVVHYAKIVRDRAVLRGLITAATEIATRGYEASGDVAELLDRAEQLIFEISERRVRNAFTKLSQVLVESIKTIERLYEQKQSVTGVPTGFVDLDRMLSGLQPSDLIIVAGRPSMGKCLTADAEIVLSDGSVRTIEEIVRARSGRLLTLTDHWKLAPADPSAFVDDGDKPVFKVTTRLGRTVCTTRSHPFLTIEGWRPLGEIQPGDHVAVPRRIDVFGERSLGAARVRLLAYLLGDGTLTGACPRFTNSNEQLRADFREAAGQFGGLAVREDLSLDRAPSLAVSAERSDLPRRRVQFGSLVRGRLVGPRGAARRLAARLGVTPASVTHWCQGKTVPSAAVFGELCIALDVEANELAPEGLPSIRRTERNALTRWLESLGIWGRTAREKFVPDVVFTLVRHEVACFLNRLFATDGWATVLASGQAQLGFCSTSERMARQVQHLLLRFGVIASLRRRRVAYRGSRRTAFQLDITDAESIRAFLGEIGIFGKEAALSRVKAALATKRYQTNRDLIPVAVWRQVDAARQGASWQSLGALMGLGDGVNLHVGRRGLSRRRLAALARVLGNKRLRDLAESDVYWDEVVAIEPMGVRRVYDLTIPDTHNFVANDICVHNTAIVLNVAEHAALRADVGVAVFSLEMAKEQLAMRMLCSEARVDLARVRTGHLSDREFPRLAMAAGRLGDAPIFIDDTPALSVLELRAKARRLKRDPANKLGLVIVDYIQLMRSSEGRDNREQEISEISRSLKALAKELHVPVLALSQLNRQVESRTPPVPRLADLRESGAIEQDADVIIFLYRDDYYNDDSDKKGLAEVIVAKQRNGPTGSVELTFLREFTRFENREVGADDEGQDGEGAFR